MKKKMVSSSFENKKINLQITIKNGLDITALYVYLLEMNL